MVAGLAHFSVMDAATITATLDDAALLCERQGARFTDLRRDVLGLILGANGPIGAYQLLDRLKETSRKRAAPPTVYRALEFLLAQGLIHRVERLNAFVGCPERHSHPAQFLICRECGAVNELEDAGVQGALATAAARHGFRVQQSTVEIEGLCAVCVRKEAVLF